MQRLLAFQFRPMSDGKPQRDMRRCARLRQAVARPSMENRGQRGFTLVDLIMVIVLMGVIGGMVAVFMKNPIDASIAGGRRAALSDVADTVVRRMVRDI